MKRILSIVLLPLAALGAGCAGAGIQDKIRLRIDAPVGAAFRTELEAKIRGDLVVRAEGKESRQSLMKDERRVMEDEILEADGDRIRKLRRKTLEWTTRLQGPGEPAPIDVPRTLVGRTITLIRTEFGTEHEGADGVSSEDLRENSIDALDAILSLPEHPVAPGERWSIDGDRIVAVLGGDGRRGMKVRQASGSARLERLESAGTARIAVVTVEIDAAGALRQLLDVGVSLKVEGTFRIDLDLRRAVSFQLTGAGTLSGEVARSKGIAVYEGRFTAAMQGSSAPR